MPLNLTICTVPVVDFSFLSLTFVLLCVLAGFQQLLLEPLFKFHHTLRKLGLQEEEYVLVQALSLFSPGTVKSVLVPSRP